MDQPALAPPAALLEREHEVCLGEQFRRPSLGARPPAIKVPLAHDSDTVADVIACPAKQSRMAW
jgi:hypothetical protein